MKTENSFLRRITPSIFRELIRFFYFKEFLFKSDLGLKSLKFSKRIVLKRLLDAYRFPKKTIWTTLFIPSEILTPLNLNPFCLEIGASLFSKIGKTQGALLSAESFGVPTDGCSFHRAAMGYVHNNFYPRSNYLAATTSLCDSNPKTLEICKANTGDNGMTTVLDVPYDFNDDSIKYLAEQLEEFTTQLEKSFGVTMDKNALKDAIECSNRTREKMVEVNRLRMSPFSPLAGSDALGLIVNSHLLCGTKEGEIFYDMLLKDLKEGIERHKYNDKENNNKIKVLWLELKPYFNNDLLTNLEDKHGVKIVFEEINYVYWDAMDPEKPYESLARKMISNQNNGPLENRLEVLKMLVEKYNVDGVIMFASWGCRRNAAAIPIIKDTLNKEGVPLLTLHGDCIDESSYTEGQFSTRLEGFLEMLKKKRAA